MIKELEETFNKNFKEKILNIEKNNKKLITIINIKFYSIF